MWCLGAYGRVLRMGPSYCAPLQGFAGSIGPWGLTGFLLRDFYLSYHNTKAVLFTIDPHCGNFKTSP